MKKASEAVAIHLKGLKVIRPENILSRDVKPVRLRWPESLLFLVQGDVAG